MKIKLLDGFCSAGGCSMGYYLGAKELGIDIEITGVDINPQPNYPFKFIQADVFDINLSEYTFIHASPPCQAYSVLSGLTTKEYPMLIPTVREMLIASGKDYIIENVYGAKSHMINPIMLCGTMFDLKVFRHRLFECSFNITQPEHISHKQLGDYKLTKQGRRPKEGEYITVTGHFTDVKYASKAMGIDWMLGKELSQAIPPAYTKYLMQEYIRYLSIS